MTTSAIVARRAFLASVGKHDRAIAAGIIQTSQKTADRPDRLANNRPAAIRSDSIRAIGSHRC